MAPESHLIPLDTEHRLTPAALLAYAKAIAADARNHHRILYADQDEHDPDGSRCRPWLKPEWDRLLFYAQDYLSAACAIPVHALLSASRDGSLTDGSDLYALLLRMLGKDDAPRPHHLPYVATTTPAGAWCKAPPERTQLVLSVAQACLGAQAESGPFGTSILRFPLPASPPKVSVIIPTRDRVDLLSTCVDGVLHRTDYPDMEVIIADNGSVESETLAYFDRCSADPRVKIVRWPYEYNYSAINNFAIGHASGAYLCLLNNDTEVLEADWLREMMSHAIRPEVGAVGARLLYPDRSIQHAGVVIGMGNAAGHAHRGLAEHQPGYFAQALVTRSATAVTAACLVVSKQKFDAVSGLDEQHLAIAYNDVDLCLKIREKGWTNIYAAQAVLLHHESKSRGQDFAPEHLARYRRELKILQERWDTVGFRDPTHHPALDPASEQYRVQL